MLGGADQTSDRVTGPLGRSNSEHPRFVNIARFALSSHVQGKPRRPDKIEWDGAEKGFNYAGPLTSFPMICLGEPAEAET
jgi:hypothetical protein